MKNTADIKKNNVNKIKKILWKGGEYSKHEIAQRTGLSVATCNTLLNEMKLSGEVVSKAVRLSEVGRTSAVYCINSDYEQILCTTIENLSGTRILRYYVMALTGKIICDDEIKADFINEDKIMEAISEIMKKYPNILYIFSGIPGVVLDGTIRDCDIPELNGSRLTEFIENKFSVPAEMENDMYYKAYGYYKRECTSGEIISIINYQPEVLPGTAAIYEGKVIKGAHGLAGMTGFLPFEVDREVQKKMMTKEKYLPFALKSSVAVMAVINPKTMIFTGRLMSYEDAEEILKQAEKYIPEEYLPEMKYISDIDEYYLFGMLQRAIDKKLEI